MVQKGKGKGGVRKGKSKPKYKNKVGPNSKDKIAYTSKGERVRPPKPNP